MRHECRSCVMGVDHEFTVNGLPESQVYKVLGFPLQYGKERPLSLARALSLEDPLHLMKPCQLQEHSHAAISGTRSRGPWTASIGAAPMTSPASRSQNLQARRLAATASAPAQAAPRISTVSTAGTSREDPAGRSGAMVTAASVRPGDDMIRRPADSPGTWTDTPPARWSSSTVSSYQQASRTVMASPPASASALSCATPPTLLRGLGGANRCHSDPWAGNPFPFRGLPSCCVAGIAMRLSNTAHTKNQNGTNVVTCTLHQSPSLLSSCCAYSTCSALCWLHCCVLRVLLQRFHRVLLQRF